MKLYNNGIKRKPFSPEYRKQISERLKGHKGYNKGVPRPLIERLKISNTMKGKIPKNNSWLKEHNKGSKRSIESRIKMSCAQYKIDISEFKSFSDVTFQKQIRTLPEYFEWRYNVLKRDDFICQYCKIKGGSLRAHHIDKFSDILEINNIITIEGAKNCNELWNLNNGLTLCEKCHINEHKKKDKL